MGKKISIKASEIQKQFWLLNTLENGNTAYNIPCIFHIIGTPDREKLKRAINHLICRHDSLRTLFNNENNELYQIIDDSGSDHLLEELEEVDLQQAITYNGLPQELIEELHQGFDLENGPLMRVKLFKISEGQYYLSFIFHHIITDLRSKEIFFRELGQLYNLSDTSFQEISGHASYALFSEQHHSWLNSDDSHLKLKQWLSELNGIEETDWLVLPAIEPVRNSGERIDLSLGESLSDSIRSFSKTNTIDPFVVLLSAYSMLLSTLNRQNEICIGVPFSNRRNEIFTNTLGCFVNILPIRLRLEMGMSVSKLLQEVRGKMLNAHRNQEVPYVQIHSNLPEHIKVFKAGFTFEESIDLHLNDLITDIIETPRFGTQLDLFFTFRNLKSDIRAFAEYSDKVFNRDFIMNLWDVYKQILYSFIEAQDLSLNKIRILPQSHWEALQNINNTNAYYDTKMLLHEHLEKQARENSSQTAIIDGETILNYGDFNRLSNKLAHHLIGLGLKPEQCVGVYMHRSYEMMLGIFAILKAGGVYVPMNIEYPAERLKLMVEDSGAVFILIDKLTEKTFPNITGVLRIDSLIAGSASEKDENPYGIIRSNNLAYLIYTSGSTGKPKGVMIEHHSVINSLGWMQKEYPLSQGEFLMQKTALSFDVSVWELFWWSFAGAGLSIPPSGMEREPAALIDFIEKHQIRIVTFVPTMFTYFLNELITSKSFHKIKSLRWIHFIGEALPVNMVNSFYNAKGDEEGPMLANIYGPAEATVQISYSNINGPVSKVLIGKPIDNSGLYTIDESNRILPVGFPGELIITGVNLARGYLNRLDLSRERFISINLPDKSMHRAYKTGDLARIDIEGGFEYLGRTDHQVKIRGMRIELGEIETLISNFSNIKNCVVQVLGENEGKKIVVWVVSPLALNEFESMLRDYLHKHLPTYMIPSTIIKVNEIPYGPNGKLDRKRLPEPIKDIPLKTNETANPIESKLREIWKEVLKAGHIGLNENFFDAGGNSLNAIGLAQRISTEFGLKIALPLIFAYPSIKEFTKYLESLNENSQPASNLTEEQNKRQERFKQMRNLRKP